MRGSAVPEGAWNAIFTSYPPTSEIATVSTAGAIGRGVIGSENVLLTPESVALGISMVHDYGSSSSYTITPRPLNYHNYTTPLPPNHDLGSTYPIRTGSSGSTHSTNSNTTRLSNNDNDTHSIAGLGYSTPSTNTHSNDPVYLPRLNAFQNPYAGIFLPRTVTAPASSVPSLACTVPYFNAPVPTLQYAHSGLQSQSRSNGSPSSQTRHKPYACNIAGCHDKRFLTLQLRLTHSRKMHKQSFPCSHPDCPRMEDYTDFESRQSLDDHWLLEHQAAKHFRCSKCCYSTGNATHMRKGHLKMHYQKGGIFQAMKEIKKEKNDRNTSSEGR